MDTTKLIEKEVERHEEHMALIRSLEPFAHLVDFVYDSRVFMKHNSTVDDFLDQLREIRATGVNMDMQGYCMNGDSLAVNYLSDAMGLVLFCSDAEGLLAKIGGGKCRLESRASTSTVVVCDV